MRITAKELDVMVDRINRRNGIKEATYKTVGAFVIDKAYGGYRVCKIVNESGGQSDKSDRGTASETYSWLCGYETALRDELREMV